MGTRAANNARTLARESGNSKYLSGTPCRNGHLAERYTSSARCVLCALNGYKEWRAVNPDFIARRDKEKHRAADARYRQAHLDAMRKKNKTYYENNSKKLIHNQAKYRALRKTAEGEYSLDDIIRIYALQRSKCGWCKKSHKKSYHVDHIKPLSKGGSNWPKNLQLLCPGCNLRKTNKDPLLWARQNGRLC